MTTLSLLVVALFMVWIQRWRYAERMHRLGIAVIKEAEYVSRDFPEEYPAYRREACAALKSHGVGYLTGALP